MVNSFDELVFFAYSTMILYNTYDNTVVEYEWSVFPNSSCARTPVFRCAGLRSGNSERRGLLASSSVTGHAPIRRNQFVPVRMDCSKKSEIDL